MKLVKPLLACGLALFVSLPALGQSRSSDRWVASWATALVARPVGQGPGGAVSGRSGGAAGGSAAAPQCTGRTGAALRSVQPRHQLPPLRPAAGEADSQRP